MRFSAIRCFVAVVVLGTIASFLPACQTNKADDPAPAASVNDPPASPVERGKYLVAIGSCNDCHTPFKLGERGPEPDMSRMLSGHPEFAKLPPAPAPQGPWIWNGSATNTAFHGPWGTTYAFNLTPDVNTGLGIWTEEMFVKAMRTGKHFGEARPIMPPMPWQGLGAMTDPDLKAVYAYLRSIPPVKNLVPDYAPPGK
jgi:mono/diheme cytochrome c family protein